MGIPAYFSHIVKQHPGILQKINKKHTIINNLLIDSNSVIYDAVRDMEYSSSNKNFEHELIKKICLKLEEYIKFITPNNEVIIAFDGVAPVAKLEQQRNRRYKTWFQKQLSTELDSTTEPSWDTTAITPGTTFMASLASEVAKYFSNPKKFSVQSIIVSSSNEAGEGEHKLFEHIRKNIHNYKDQKTIIYGLDADLIMLTINHLPIARNLFLFRETPHFIRSIDKTLDPNSLYMLRIPHLAQAIINKLNNGNKITKRQEKNRLYDYIFMTFLLGNDFIPHFPALNIRTYGIDHLMDAYAATLGNTDKNITDGKIIYWSNLRLLISNLQENEHQFIEMEYERRNRQAKRRFPNNTKEEKDQRFQAIPLIDRKVELYINPYEDFWQERYYKELFDIEPSEANIKNICVNFLEALEWTFKYYSHKCPDWRWCYKYNYPPLLQDLIRYIPYFETDFITEVEKNPVDKYVQLAYVLPRDSLSLLPSNITEHLLTKHPDWYHNNCNFQWAYCKYFWESHVILPDICIDTLEKDITSFNK